MEQLNLVWQIIGLLALFVIQTIGLTKFLINRIDMGDADGRAERTKQIDALHARINEVREDYVRRDDLAQHIQRLEANMANVREDLKEHAKISRDHAGRMDKRIDDVLAAIATIGKVHHEKPGR